MSVNLFIIMSVFRVFGRRSIFYDVAGDVLIIICIVIPFVIACRELYIVFIRIIRRLTRTPVCIAEWFTCYPFIVSFRSFI